MNTSVRVFGNTVVLYVKIIVSTFVGLFLTRVVLDVLGIEDFGIYNLIAGIIAILAFVESSLTISTQRYISLALGQGDVDRVRRYFSAGIQIHLGIAFVIAIILEICGLFLFDGFLNIPAERIEVARQIYQLMVLSMVATIVCIPYNAAINAYEDIWYYGLVQTLCTLMRLGLIVGFKYIHTDALWLYAAWMVTTTLMGVLASVVWCMVKYSSVCRVRLSLKSGYYDVREMLGFTGWNTLGAFAVVCRNQGVSIVLNVFFGPAINGVYGIANQVDGQLVSFANTLTSSMTPQIVKSQGAGNGERLCKLSVFTCKTAFMLSAFFALPLLIELPLVLGVWLKEVPPYTELYCRTLLFIFLICELYPGLSRGIQAVGNIKWQQIWSAICVVLPIPIGIIFFKMGMSHFIIIYLMLFAQVGSFAVSVYWSWRLFNLHVGKYLWFVVKAVALFLVMLGVGYFFDSLLMQFTSDITRFIIISILSSSVFVALFFWTCIDQDERTMINNLIHQVLKR